MTAPNQPVDKDARIAELEKQVSSLTTQLDQCNALRAAMRRKDKTLPTVEEVLNRISSLHERAMRAENTARTLIQRQKTCATLDEAQKLALVRALQEIRDAMELVGGDGLSPANIVEGVRQLQARHDQMQQQLEEHAESWALCGIPHDSLLAKTLVLTEQKQKAESDLAAALAIIGRWKEFLQECETAEDRSNLDGDDADTVLAQINEGATEMLKLAP